MGESAIDTDLLERWRAGQVDAGQQLFQRHFDSIFSFFQTKSEADADELTQATFLACLRAKDQFRGAASFRTYLFSIARNELYRVLRERYRDNAHLDFDASSMAQLISTPATKMARSQEHRKLLEALRELPVEQQTLLELHYWEEMDAGELAEVFEAPEATIRTRLHRARKALKAKIEGFVEPQALESLDTMDRWARELTVRGSR